MLGVGFEPTHLSILELESSALDHSAIQAIIPEGLAGHALSAKAGCAKKIESPAKGEPLEHQGFDPCTSRLQSGHSTN